MASLAMFLFALAGCDSGEDQAKKDDANQPLPAVTVTPVVSKEISDQAEFIGQANAYQKVNLRARVTGFLLERAFTEGGNVKQGDLLYKIEPDEYKAAVKAAEAAIQRTKATIEEAEQDLARYAKLTAQGTTSEQKLEEAKATAGRAKADLEANNAQLEKAKLNLSYTDVISPLSGSIGRSSVDVGNLIGPDSGILATVLDTDPIRVVFSISESALLRYRKARIAGDDTPIVPKLQLADGDMYEQDGEVEFIDDQVDTSTGTVQVRVQFPNPDTLIIPGQFVTVVLISGEAKQQVVVPQAAVQANQQGYFVMVLEEGDVVKVRPVKTGQRVDADWVITEGLTAGEMIVTEGIQKIRPGAKVKPVTAQPAEGGN